MNTEMIFAGTQLVGMVLSFTLLLRARRLSVELWSTRLSYQRSYTKSNVEQLAEISRIFRM
jgi:hypothetical protein